MMRYLANMAVVAVLGLISWGCPTICPGCSSLPGFHLSERHEILGIVTKQCIRAMCDIRPWCLEAVVTSWLGPIRWTSFLISESESTFLTGPDVDAYVRGGVATVCVRHAYEVVIPLGGAGRLTGRRGLIRIPVRGLRGQSCMGICPCEGRWVQPIVTTVVRPSGDPRRPQVHIWAFDLDGDLVCIAYRGPLYGGLTNGTGPRFEAFALHRSCVYKFIYEPPARCDPITDFVVGWARDTKGLDGSHGVIFTIPGNQPPQASPSSLHGETTVTLTPEGIVRGPVVMSIHQSWDLDGDEVTVHWGDLPPMYAQQISLFLASVVMMYWPDAADVYCRVVREEDVLMDEFTVILRDACGAGT